MWNRASRLLCPGILSLVAACVPSHSLEASTEGASVTIFAGTRDEASAARVALIGMLERVAASMWGATQAPAELVTVLPRGGGRRRTSGWEVQVHLPEGVTTQQLLAAISADETCRAGQTGCSERCSALRDLAAAGHFHVTPPEGMRECLVAFMGSVEPGHEEAGELDRVVMARRAELGLPRRPRVERLRVTLGRPDFSPSFGPPK